MRRYRATRLSTDINPDMDVMLDEAEDEDEIVLTDDAMDYEEEVALEETPSEEESVIGVVEE